ncbi:MAG: MarR family transcriptional regulator [Planctomycetales bacterium]|nr:MarR family transcriptional regulator [Planctomycetales bacterium]
MANDKSDRCAADEVAFEILRSIRKILRRTSQYSRQISRQAGMSVPQLLCLKAISDAADVDELTAAMLAKRVQLSSPTVTRIIDRLEVAGYVQRERRSADRRKICLSLTELGRQRLERLPVPLDEQFLQRLRTLEPAARNGLLRSLEQIVEMMDAQQLDAAPVLTTELEMKPSE